MRSVSATCSGSSDFGQQHQVRRFGNNLRQVFEAQGQLVDAHHALAFAEIHGAQRVADKNARGIFFRVMDGIFKIENDGVRPVQRRVDEVLGLGAGKIQTRAAQAIARRWFRQRDLFRRSLAPEAQPGAPRGGLDPRRNYEGQRAFIAEFDAGMLDAEHVEHLPRLRQNGVAVVGRDPGLHRDLEAAAVARFDGHVQVGAHVACRSARLRLPPPIFLPLNRS